MGSTETVRDYFDREANRFDAIYEEKKPIHQRFVDHVFRRVVVERFRLICNLAPQPGDWSVLDVGCGPGRYAVALAKRGAKRVLGIDVSAAMIDVAQKEAERLGFANICEFQTKGFDDFNTQEKFDVITATGYFDYLENPVTHLQKMAECCKGRIFASIPKRYEYRVPIRKLRFWLEKGYVRFYSRKELNDLILQSGLSLERSAVIDLGRDWILIARV